MSKSGTVPFATTQHIRDRCLCLHVQRAARTIARHFDDAFRPLGLTNGQFSLLMSLNRADPARMSSVADLLGMDRTTLTAALKSLQARGLIDVSVDPEDRRGRLLTLTGAGNTLLASAVPIWKNNHGKVEALLADADRARRDLRDLDLRTLDLRTLDLRNTNVRTRPAARARPRA